MKLDTILDVARAAFEEQLAKVGTHGDLHDTFFETHWSRVSVHVSVKCYEKEGMTPELVQKCVKEYWTLKAIQAELKEIAAATKKAATPVQRTTEYYSRGGTRRYIRGTNGRIGAARYA